MKHKKIEMEEVNNGWWIKMSNSDSSKEYVYSYTEELRMLSELGRFVIDSKVKVERE